MATQVSHATYFTTLAASVAVVLGLSGACDKAIETRLVAIEKQESLRHGDHEGRLKRIESWQDRFAKGPE